MGKIFVVGDMHSMRDVYEYINSTLDVDDIVISVGDILDRGEDSIQLFNDIVNNPHWVLLKGNHEDLLVECINYYREGMKVSAYESYYDAIHLSLGKQNLLIKTIEELPIAIKIELNGNTFYISHSGAIRPMMNSFDNVREIEYLYSPRTGWLWDRDECCREYTLDKNVYNIHGHTPISENLWERKYRDFDYNYDYEAPFYYNNNQCINLDLSDEFKVIKFCLNDFSYETIESFI